MHDWEWCWWLPDGHRALPIGDDVVRVGIAIGHGMLVHLLLLLEIGILLHLGRDAEDIAMSALGHVAVRPASAALDAADLVVEPAWTPMKCMHQIPMSPRQIAHVTHSFSPGDAISAVFE
jgi:hypothetical protein